MSKGFALNFKNDNVMTFEQENELYAGQSIKLKFKQEEKQFELEFKVGQDVEWAKKCVAEILDCSRNDFDLIFEEKVYFYYNLITIMPEFFSLNDIPNLKDQSYIIIKMKI